MRSDWLKTTVGEFCPFEYGKGLPERSRRNGKFPVVSSAGVVGTHDTPFVRTPGIVIGRKGTVGSITLCRGPFWPIDTAFFVADAPATRDLLFVYYLLKTLGLEGMNSDSAVPGLNRENAHALTLQVPNDLAQQRMIGRFLGNLDERIELLHQSNLTLEAIAQSIFKSWFVDFDPVRAKAECREPEGVDSETASLFSSTFESSELGPIPRGWTVQKLGQILELVYGKALKATDRRAGKVPVYGSGGITGLHDVALVPHASVVVGRKGTVGSLFWEDRPFFAIDTTFYVRPVRAPLTFCYYALQRLGLQSMNTDAAVPGLNRDNAYRLPLVIPTDSLLFAFDEVAKDGLQNLRMQP